MLWQGLPGFEYHECFYQLQYQVLCIHFHFCPVVVHVSLNRLQVFWLDGGTINDGNHHCGVHNDWNSYTDAHRFVYCMLSTAGIFYFLNYGWPPSGSEGEI